MHVEAKLEELGLKLPEPLKAPEGVRIPFAFRVQGRRVFVAGHGPQALYGPEVGRHARSAVGMAELPFGIPVEIEAELQID